MPLNKISNKISQCIRILNRFKHFLPIQTKLIIYNSLVLSHLNFGIFIWGFKCERLTELQKKVIRIISLSKYKAHTEPLFKKYNLLKLCDVIKLQELKSFVKYNKLPNYLQSLPFHPNTETHDHATRISHTIHQLICKHTFAKCGIHSGFKDSLDTSEHIFYNLIRNIVHWWTAMCVCNM